MVLQFAGGLTIAIWVYLLAARRSEWTGSVSEIPKAQPRVAVIIPARDEERTIAEAVSSLSAQDYGGAFHIVVVDDHSGDRTAAEAMTAAPAGRLTVIRAEPLPPGWTGKLWAMSQGVSEAARFHPDYLLFTDADIVHPTHNLRGLVARAQAGDYALVSYMATLRCRSIAERMLVPAFVFFFFLLYPPRRVRDRRRRDAGAAGGCILLRADALKQSGGLHAIRGELIDDCALAHAVKQAGGRIWLGLSPETRSIRPYDTFAEAGRMISRTAFTQLRYSALLLMATLLALAVTFWLPPVLTVAAPQPARGMGALAWLLMSAAYVPALRYYRQSVFWAPLLPLVAAVYGWYTICSAVAHWRGTGGLWKGRAQAGQEKRV